jgi:Ca2+-binding RTX toxin-like protein
MTSLVAGTADGRETSTRPHAGPPYQYTTELMGQFVVIPLKDQGQLTKTDHGYRFRTGQQNSHLVVTLTYGKLHLVDTGTKSWKKLSPACQKEKVKVGIAAVCRVPAGISVQKPLLLEVWPRLGNDYTDTSSLPATFAVTVLGDKGRDVAHLGAGPDFFNGHSGRDVVWGGAGDDWIRAGLDNDVVWGGAGNDDLVAMQGRDSVHGGDGDDRVGGAEGGDRLWGDAGTDFILCGPGHDNAKADSADRIFHDCEAVVRR